MKVAVLGANGQLGADCVSVFREAGHEVSALTHQDVEVADPASLKRALEPLSAEIVVNTAAFHNVDRCEDEPERSFKVNALAPRALAELSNALGFQLIHVSTDFVFDGSKGAPYAESDRPAPLSVYGNSKLSGELFVAALAKRYFILRTSAIYGLNPCRAKGGDNFIRMMLRLARERGEVRAAEDQIVSPTFTEDIARQMLDLLGREDSGLVHAASQGAVSWHDFAQAIFEITDTRVRLTRAKAADFPMKAKRPLYSALQNAALKARGIDRMPPWRDALERYLSALPAPAR